MVATATLPYERYLEAVVAGDKARARSTVTAQMDAGWTVDRVYREILEPAQVSLGGLWETGKLSVAQEHFASAVTQLLMCQLYPDAVAGVRRNGQRALVGAVGSEMHEIGVRMFGDFLDMAGWESFQVGGNLPAASIPDAAADYDVHLIALSATLSSHLPFVQEAIEAVRADRRVQHIPVLLGGGAFGGDAQLAARLGADGYARDASHGVQIAAELTAKRNG